MIYEKLHSKIYAELKAFLRITPVRYKGKPFFLVKSSFVLGKKIKVACFFENPLTVDYILDCLLGRMLMAAAEKYDMNIRYSEILDDFWYSLNECVLDDSPFVSFHLPEKEGSYVQHFDPC